VDYIDVFLSHVISPSELTVMSGTLYIRLLQSCLCVWLTLLHLLV